MKYRVYGTVVGSKYIGEVEADSEEEAEEKAWELDNCSASMCHQCSRNCEDAEIAELHRTFNKFLASIPFLSLPKLGFSKEIQEYKHVNEFVDNLVSKALSKMKNPWECNISVFEMNCNFLTCKTRIGWSAFLHLTDELKLNTTQACHDIYKLKLLFSKYEKDNFCELCVAEFNRQKSLFWELKKKQDKDTLVLPTPDRVYGEFAYVGENQNTINELIKRKGVSTRYEGET